MRQYFTVDDVVRLKEAIIRELKTLAVKKGIVASENDAIVRELLPSDLGLNSWAKDLSGGTANQYNDAVSTTLSDKKIIAIYGLRLLGSSSNVDNIKFLRGDGATKDIWDANGIKVKEDKTTITEDDRVIRYENSETVKIQYYITATGTEEIQLLGFVVEPKGETISF